MEDEFNRISGVINNILPCKPEELSARYRAYKKAEAEFKEVYDVFKKDLLALYETENDIPKTIVMGNIKTVYVAPSTRNTIDTKKLKEEYPVLAKELTKSTAVSATLRIDDVVDYSNGME